METATTPRRLTRDERKAETRERLLAAAGRVFARRGYQAAAVDEVADEAGFSTGALYSNFDGKEISSWPYSSATSRPRSRSSRRPSPSARRSTSAPAAARRSGWPSSSASPSS